MTDSLSDYEFERRFKVTETSILKDAASSYIEQAYLWASDGYAVRVRVSQASRADVSDARAQMDLKGPRSESQRYEISASIDDLEHARRILELEPRRIQKTRYSLLSEGEAWEIDVFEGENSGLVIAEFEGSAEAVARIRKPWWAGDEVTDDDRYNNENLAKRPWAEWGRYE